MRTKNLSWRYINQRPIPLDLLDARRKAFKCLKNILIKENKTLGERMAIYCVDCLFTVRYLKPELSI